MSETMLRDSDVVATYRASLKNASPETQAELFWNDSVEQIEPLLFPFWVVSIHTLLGKNCSCRHHKNDRGKCFLALSPDAQRKRYQDNGKSGTSILSFDQFMFLFLFDRKIFKASLGILVGCEIQQEA